MRSFLVAVMLSVFAHPVYADEVLSPICVQPPVLERVSALLQQAGRPMRLLPDGSGETSAGTGRLVHCAVRGAMTGYDTNHYGLQPIDAIFVIRYTLELRQNGMFLRLD